MRRLAVRVLECRRFGFGIVIPLNHRGRKGHKGTFLFHRVPERIDLCVLCILRGEALGLVLQISKYSESRIFPILFAGARSAVQIRSANRAQPPAIVLTERLHWNG